MIEYIVRLLDDLSFLAWFFIVAKIFKWDLGRLLKVRWYHFAVAYLLINFLEIIVRAISLP